MAKISINRFANAISGRLNLLKSDSELDGNFNTRFSEIFTVRVSPRNPNLMSLFPESDTLGRIFTFRPFVKDAKGICSTNLNISDSTFEERDGFSLSCVETGAKITFPRFCGFYYKIEELNITFYIQKELPWSLPNFSIGRPYYVSEIANPCILRDSDPCEFLRDSDPC